MDRRVEKVLLLISNIFGDTSVPLEKTLELMEEIADDANAKCDALREDIKTRDRKTGE